MDLLHFLYYEFFFIETYKLFGLLGLSQFLHFKMPLSLKRINIFGFF